MKDKNCFACEGSIKNDSDYYLVQTYLKGTFVGKRYVHKECMDGLAELRKQSIKLIQKINNGH